MSRTVRGTVQGMAVEANPAFAVAAVAVPFLALAYALFVAPIQQHTYVHVMAGVVWTGFDLLMGLMVGPTVASLSESGRAEFFRKFTPKSAFLMPAVAIVTIAAGLTLAIRLGYFPTAGPWLALFTLVNLPGALLLIGWQFDAWTDWRWLAPFALAVVGTGLWVATTISGLEMVSGVMLAALGIVTLLNLEGFGLIFPGEVRVFLEMTSNNPDEAVIGAVGQRNAKLAGVQGVLQVGLIVVMVYARWGGF